MVRVSTHLSAKWNVRGDDERTFRCRASLNMNIHSSQAFASFPSIFGHDAAAFSYCSVTTWLTGSLATLNIEWLTTSEQPIQVLLPHTLPIETDPSILLQLIDLH